MNVALPDCLLPVLRSFAPLFSGRTFTHAAELAAGAILAPGKRTVTSALRVLGRSADKTYQNFHRVLNRAQWSALGAGRTLLGLLVDAFAPSGPVLLGLDDTIERRRGERISAKGVYRDPVRSSHSHFVKTTGLRWLSFMLLARVEWAERLWALPCLTVLSPSERYYKTRGLSPRTLLDRALQGLRLIKRWLPGRDLVVVADSSFAALDWLSRASRQASVITRPRTDAALHEPVAQRLPGTRGRPRRKGARPPSLSEVIADKATTWSELRLDNWYGKGERAVSITTGTAVWTNAGKPAVPIRWVVVKDPAGRSKPQALLSTNQAIAAPDIVRHFIGRWQMEVTFEESRAHLGVETQRQWSDRAIVRTTPALLGLYSVVTLAARRLIATGVAMPVRTAAWYEKKRPTFSDTIALVRRSVWEGFSRSPSDKDMIKVPRTLLEGFTDALCYAQ